MAGLLDTDLQQDLLAEKDITLDKAVNMAVTRETEKRSQLAMDNKETAAGFLCLYKAGQIFLEAHEKEIIIEKVLPRMRLLFDNVRSLNGRLAIGDKLNIEKRLLENAEESQAKRKQSLDARLMMTSTKLMQLQVKSIAQLKLVIEVKRK